MRTGDLSYGPDYWNTLDNGLGYNDSTMWEDIAHIQKELFGYRDGRDVAGEMQYLDVGCAKGYLVKHMYRRGFESWGTDFSEYAITEADPLVKSRIRRHDLTTPMPMQWNDDYFKLVSCYETMEHIPEDGVAQALWHIKRVCCRYALFTICTSEHPDPFDDPTHVTIKPREWWLAELIKAGYTPQPELERRIRNYYLFSAHAGVFICRTD